MEGYLDKLAEPQRVKRVAIDMHEPFHQTAQMSPPQAKIVADRFHLIRRINSTPDKVRSKLQEGNRKGKRSERRFTRRTEEQKRDFLRKVSNRIEERFKNYTMGHILFGGNRLIRKPLLKECTYLELEAYKIPKGILNIKYASTEALNHSLEEITKPLLLAF